MKTAALLWLGILTGIAAERADAPLRYHFAVGQQLVYSGESKFAYQTGTFDTKLKSTLWVVAANADGSWEVLAKTESTMHRVDSQMRGYTEPDHVEILWNRAAVFPDGRVANAESTREQQSGFPGIVKLPATADEMKSGWDTTDEHGTTHYTVTNASGGRVLIHSVHSGPEDPIYLITSASDITFDLKQGLITHVTDTGSQGYGFVGKTTGDSSLQMVDAAPIMHLKRLSDEFTAYLAAQKSSEALISGSAPPAELAASADKMKPLLEKAKADAPDFADAIDEELKNLPQEIDYEKQDAQKRQALLAAPAAGWKTTDLKGQPHALADYRGQVVVLDFWYRGCGWCMLAMPQVKEAAAHFAGQPVTFLAMCTDLPETKDADFVAEKMQLPYPTLYAKDIAQGYQLNGFPTLLILDAKGVVRFIHVGYARDLRDRVVADVEKLLPPQAK